MPAIDTLLKRLGFVRLDRYGLVLTPEGRIMSLRPAVLDDGLGGRIVGWPDGDLAAMELQKWEPARPAPKTAVATRVAAAPPPIPLPKPIVAEPEQVEEDDWEWEIALARARAAAEEAELAAASARVSSRARLDTVPPPVAQPKLPVVVIPPRVQAEPITTIDYEDRTAVITNRPPPKAPPPPPPVAISVKTTQVVAIPPAPVAQQARPGTTPPTIIPIPKLPSIKDRSSQIQPVVAPSSRPSRTRLAKGTGPVVNSNTHVGVAPPPVRADDKTSPSIALPESARAVTLPAIKRVARR